MNELEKIKISKFSLINCKIISIKYLELLEEFGVVKNNNIDNKRYYFADDGNKFKYLKIDEDDFILKAGVSPFGDFGEEYCTLEVNLRQSSSIEECNQQLIEIQKFLQDEYKILVDFSEAKLKEVEISRVFTIENDFNSYGRVLKLIISQMPKMQKISTVATLENTKTTYETFSVWNRKENTTKSRSFKKIVICNENKKYENTTLINKNYMRFEIKLFGTANVKKSLKIERFINLTQDIVENWFNEQVNTLIVKPIAKWEKIRDKQIKVIVKDEISKGGNWVINTLRKFTAWDDNNGTPLILDISDIFPIIDKLSIDNRKRVKDRFLQQALKYETTLTLGDNDKLNEFIYKLLQ